MSEMYRLIKVIANQKTFSYTYPDKLINYFYNWNTLKN